MSNSNSGPESNHDEAKEHLHAILIALVTPTVVIIGGVFATFAAMRLLQP